MHLRDFQHAARLYRDNYYSLAPKNKFLYYVNFNLTAAGRAASSRLASKYLAELNMLCKSVDLPQYSANVEVKNQYNRKKLVQTRIDYTPVKITMHDDNAGISTLLLESYYRYYYKDGTYYDDVAAFQPNNLYETDDKKTYGFETPDTEPFFESITIYQMSRQQFTEFTLVNPVIERWGHDTMDQTDGAGIVENNLEISYESVYYSRGTVDIDNPATFATRRYDVVQSPLGGKGDGPSPYGQIGNEEPPGASNSNPSESFFGKLVDSATNTLTNVATNAILTGKLPSLKEVGAQVVNNATDVALDSVIDAVTNAAGNALLSTPQIDTVSKAIQDGKQVPQPVLDQYNAQTGANNTITAEQTQALLNIANNNAQAQGGG